jgi:CHAT domain-containing protein
MERPRPIKSDLVVFSGCDTAQFDEPGTVRPGQLSQAALLAGAQEVIASLWNVDSVATSAWMKRFYGQLAAGRTASSAVANAALEMKQDLRRAHPRYWAAFADFDRYPDSH